MRLPKRLTIHASDGLDGVTLEFTGRSAAQLIMGDPIVRGYSFIHEIADSAVEDVTADILAEAALPAVEADGIDLQASRFDHLRDLRKHEPT